MQDEQKNDPQKGIFCAFSQLRPIKEAQAQILGKNKQKNRFCMAGGHVPPVLPFSYGPVLGIIDSFSYVLVL